VKGEVENPCRKLGGKILDRGGEKRGLEKGNEAKATGGLAPLREGSERGWGSRKLTSKKEKAT